MWIVNCTRKTYLKLERVLCGIILVNVITNSKYILPFCLGELIDHKKNIFLLTQQNIKKKRNAIFNLYMLSCTEGAT